MACSTTCVTADNFLLFLLFISLLMLHFLTDFSQLALMFVRLFFQAQIFFSLLLRLQGLLQAANCAAPSLLRWGSPIFSQRPSGRLPPKAQTHPFLLGLEFFFPPTVTFRSVSFPSAHVNRVVAFLTPYGEDGLVFITPSFVSLFG